MPEHNVCSKSIVHIFFWPKQLLFSEQLEHQGCSWRIHVLKIQVSLKDHSKCLMEENTQTFLHCLSRQLPFTDLSELNRQLVKPKLFLFDVTNITKHQTSVTLQKEWSEIRILRGQSWAMCCESHLSPVKIHLLNPNKWDLEDLNAQWRSGRVPGLDPSSRFFFWFVFWCNNHCESLSAKGSYLIVLTSLQLHLFILLRWVSFTAPCKSFNSLAVKIKSIHFVKNKSTNFVRALWKWAVWELISEFRVIFLTTIH